MYTSLAVLGFAATTMAKAIPQGGSPGVAAPGAPKAGCLSSWDQSFMITVVNATNSNIPGLSKRQDPNLSPGMGLTLNVNNGVLKNAEGDTGYIADNFQLQFDNPPQAGAGYTSGFSVCPVQTTQGQQYYLALGGTNSFTACKSTDQTGRQFNNLYNQTGRNIDPSFCSPIFIQASTGNGGSSSMSGGSGSATQVGDNQPQATSASAGVTQISDNQAQAPSASAGVTQISDNQPQAPSASAGVTQISDNQPQAPTSAPAVTQISDNQPQAPTSAPAVTQISDNQPQAPAAITPAPAPASPSPVYQGAAATNGLSNLALAGAAAVGLALL